MTAQRPGARVSLGLDFGSTAVRAAFALPDQPARRMVPAASATGAWPWLLCEPAETGALPVTFPSLKSKLGSGRPVRAGGGSAAPEETVTRMLRRLREQVEEASGAAVAQTVISVPVRYRSAQRAALRNAALAAGLGQVQLIGDSMAAVIGHLAGRDSGTCLVYGMGYDGFEVGLVRGVRGNYRALGYEGAATSGGRTFDEAALATAVRLLPRRAGPSGLAGLDETGWLRLRGRAQRVRERLSSTEGISSAVLDLGTDPPLQVVFQRSEMDTYLDRHVDRTLRRARTLLEESGMGPADIDVLLLVGGSTRMERIASRVEGLGRRCVRAPCELLALGALMHARRLGGAHRPGVEESAMVWADPSEDTLADAPPLTATLLDAPVSPAPPAATAALDVAAARHLAEQGRTREATALLHRIVAEARKLLGQVEQRTEPSGERADEHSALPPARRPSADAAGETATRRIARARALVEQRRYEQAVRISHAAWQEAATGPAGADVLDAMIDIHCAAAMADVDPGRFADAERWLQCAYGHDPTNVKVRGLLAERTYQHAVELQKLGERSAAVQALERCLAWDPEHSAAEALSRRLGRHRRNHRGMGDVLG